MKRIIFGIGRAFGTAGRATIALIGICTVGVALANYTMTQGSGTNFGSIVVSTVHYAQQLLCDPTTPSQCAAVSAAGAQKVDGSAVTQPVSGASGQFVDGWDATQGAKTDTVCSTATGTCSIAALIKFLNSQVAAPSTGLAATTTTTNTYTNGQTSAINTDLHGNISINPSQLPTVTNPAPVVGAVNTTPTDCSSTITSGGTAQAAIAAQTTLHGFTIGNIDSTAGSGEPLWISFTGTAAASTAGSYPLAAPTATTFAGFSSYSTPPGFGTNHAVSIIGVTTGHKFSCTWW